MLRTHAISHHDGYRSRKAQGTWTADDQHGNASRQSKSHALTGDQPHQNGYNGNRNHCRNENTRYLICNFGDRRLGGSRVADHLDDLGKSRVLANSCGAAADKTGLVDGRRRHRIAHFLIHRNTLAGQRRLIDRAAPL